MDKKQLKKNRLDLEYHGESQKANAFLILLTTGILGFFGTFIWLMDNELIYYGIATTLVIMISGLLFYRKSSNRMREILDEIEEIHFTN